MKCDRLEGPPSCQLISVELLNDAALHIKVHVYLHAVNLCRVTFLKAHRWQHLETLTGLLKLMLLVVISLRAQSGLQVLPSECLQERKEKVNTWMSRLCEATFTT